MSKWINSMVFLILNIGNLIILQINVYQTAISKDIKKEKDLDRATCITTAYNSSIKYSNKAFLNEL